VRTFPFSARMVPEFEDPNRRETFVYEYRLMYRVEPMHIEILRVVHGRRLLSNVRGSFEETAQATYTSA
jgi:toxin ParE1/3/4